MPKKSHKAASGPTGMTVNVDPGVQAALTAFCGDTRIKKQVLARLITWFCEQDRTVQTLIVDRDTLTPEDVDAIADVVLDRLHHRPRDGPPPGQRSSAG